MKKSCCCIPGALFILLFLAFLNAIPADTPQDILQKVAGKMEPWTTVPPKSVDTLQYTFDRNGDKTILKS